MRKCTKRYLHKVQLYLSQQPYQEYSHCLFSALPPRFSDVLYLSLIFSTGVDSPCKPYSPTCWHPSVHWVTQPVVKQDSGENGLSDKVTRHSECDCISHRNSSCTTNTVPASHAPEVQSSSRCQNVARSSCQTCGTQTHLPCILP